MKYEAKPLEESIDTFWQGCCGPRSFEVNPRRPEVEGAVLERLGAAPFSIGKDNLASLLSKAYEIASRTAIEKAEGKYRYVKILASMNTCLAVFMRFL